MEKENETIKANKAKQLLDSVKNSWKSPEKNLKKAVILAVVLLFILFFTNPNTIPFLSDGARSVLRNAASGIFGDLSDVASVISFNWITFFQLVVMILCLVFLKEVLTLVVGSVKAKANRVRTVQHIVLSSLRYVFVLLGFFWGLSILGVDISTILAGAGIITLIIGFGAESMISDVVTGIFMLFENEYNVGDIVEIDGYRGTVDKIGIRTTSLRDVGGNVKIVNNGDIRNIVNLSSAQSVSICDLPIPYEADLQQAKTVLEKELLPQLKKDFPDIFREVPQFLGVQELGDSAVVLRIVANVEEDKRFAAVRAMNWVLKTGMEQHGMGAPYSQVVLHGAAKE